jgi:hypothetical protein
METVRGSHICKPTHSGAHMLLITLFIASEMIANFVIMSFAINRQSFWFGGGSYGVAEGSAEDGR